MAAQQAGKLSLLLLGGGRDRLVAAVNLAASALALGREVSAFFSWEALLHLSQGTMGRAPLPEGLAAFADRVDAALKQQGSLDAMLQELRRGGLKVYACSNTLPTLGIDPATVENKVDGISGATAFLAMAEGAQVICF